MKTYNKLVRDKIPDIIASEGSKYEIEILDDEKFKLELNKKLLEEVNEYLEDNNVYELADIVEVIYEILNSMGISISEFEDIRKSKLEKRGGFTKKIFLKRSE